VAAEPLVHDHLLQDPRDVGQVVKEYPQDNRLCALLNRALDSLHYLEVECDVDINKAAVSLVPFDRD
jgi:hypothetical protein